MRQSLRRWNGLSIVALPLVGACYVYAPVTTPDPQPGVRLTLDLNDQGRAALVTSVGPEAAQVDGALVSDIGGEYVIRVAGVVGRQGVRTKWNGETVTLRQEYVRRIRERKFSRGRTVFTIAGVLGAVVGLAAGTNLVGFGSGGDGKPGSGVGEGQ